MEPNKISTKQLKSIFFNETVEINGLDNRLSSLRVLNTQVQPFDNGYDHPLAGNENTCWHEIILYRKSRKHKPIYTKIVKFNDKHVKIILGSKTKKIKSKQISKKLFFTPLNIYVDRKIGEKASKVDLACAQSLSQIFDLKRGEWVLVEKPKAGEVYARVLGCYLDKVHLKINDSIKHYILNPDQLQRIKQIPQSKSFDESVFMDIITVPKHQKSKYDYTLEKLPENIRYKLRAMGITDTKTQKKVNERIENIRKSYTNQNFDYMRQWAKTTVNVFGCENLKGLEFEDAGLEGMQADEATLFYLETYYEFDAFCKDNGLYDRYTGLENLVKRRISMQEKMFISAALENIAQNKEYFFQNAFKQQMIKVLQKDIKDVFLGSETEGAWSWGYSEHYVVLQYEKVSPDSNLLFFRIFQVGFGSREVHSYLTPGKIINEFTIGNKKIPTYSLTESGSKKKDSAFVGDKAFVENELIPLIIPNMIDLLIRGSSNSFLEWLKTRNNYQKNIRDTLDRPVVYNALIDQTRQHIGSCTMSSQKALDKKVFGQANLEEAYERLKNFKQQRTLENFAVSINQFYYGGFPLITMSKVDLGKTYMPQHVFKQAWLKHMCLSQKHMQNRRKTPYNQIFSVNLGLGNLNFDIKELIGDNKALIIGSNVKSSATIIRIPDINSLKIEYVNDKLVLTNLGPGDMYKALDRKSFPVNETLQLGGNDNILLNLAAKSKKGFLVNFPGN